MADGSAITAALASGDASKMAAQLESESRVVIEIESPADVKSKDGVTGAVGAGEREEIVLAPDDVQVRISAREGFAVETAGEAFAILDTEITRDLMLEGIAREIVSKSDD